MMNKNKIQKARITQQLLQDLATRADKLTTDNVIQETIALRTITNNLNEVMVRDLIQCCETQDKELKQLLEKIETNMRAINNVLEQINQTNVENGKTHITLWYKFYADTLNDKLKKYEQF